MLNTIDSRAMLISNQNFAARLETILSESFDGDFKAAVGIVQCGDRWLLGLSTAKDDRANRWVFPGGGVKSGESAKKAAVREVWEETGIRCKAVGEPFRLVGKKDVAFVHCKATRGQKFDNNHEFTAIGWFTRREMKSLKLYHNVQKLLDRVT